MLRDYVWWSAQDAIDYADGQLSEALHQLRAGKLGDEYVPSAEDLSWARRQLLHQTDLLWPERRPHLALDLVQRFERGLRELARGPPATGKASRRRR